MSIKLATLVRGRIIGSAALKAVLLNMADRADDDGANVFSSKATIAGETELSRATVFRTVEQLVSLGLIVATGTMPCRGGSTVIYRIAIDAVSALPEWRDETPHQMHPARNAPPQQMQPTSPGAGPVREVTSPPAGPHPSHGETPTSLTVRPHPSHGETPTSLTVRPKPSLELSLNCPSEGEGERERDVCARMSENIQIDGWTPSTLLDAVIKVGEAQRGSRNWRSPAVSETIWSWLAQYEISPHELLAIIKSSRLGHPHELPKSPMAFVGDIKQFVNIRNWNNSNRAKDITRDQH